MSTVFFAASPAELRVVAAAAARADTSAVLAALDTVPAGDLDPAQLIDLDLLDFRGETAAGGPGQAILPHPRMTTRGFVLRPLADLAPAWRDPASGTPIQALLAALPADQTIEPL